MKARFESISMKDFKQSLATGSDAQMPRNFEQIRRRAQEIYRARRGITGMTLNDWLKTGQELKQELAKETN